MITTIDPILSVRGKLLGALKADSELAAYVGTRIYPSKTPATLVWSFVRLDGMASIPVRVDGVSGAEISGMIHTFVKLGAAIPDPEATCANINAHIVRIIDALEEVVLNGETKLSVMAVGSQIIPDSAEADAYHGIVSYSGLAL